MKTSLKAILLATTMSAASVDAAFAKNGNGGGNGQGAGNGNGKGETASASRGGGNGNGKGNGQANRGGGFADTQIGGFIGKAFGLEKKSNRSNNGNSATARASGAVTSSPAPAPRVKKNDDPMHPSNLGNANAMLIASPNAIAAHMRNGNTNGPIGAMAALATAKIGAVQAEENLEEQVAAFGFTTVEDYEAALAGVAGIAGIEGLDDAIANYDPENPDSVATLGTQLAAAGFLSEEDRAAAQTGTVDDSLAGALQTGIEDYGAAVEGTPGIDPIGEIESAIAEAETTGETIAAAEQNALSTWNKNPDEDPATVSPEKDAFLGKLHDRLAADADVLGSELAPPETDDPEMTPEEGEEGVDDLALVTE